ncbi:MULTISPECIES: hypothetical protein [Sporosarcina]|uniref:hypothetical protein n=1 Tax=Sporosarcina TaxID=1569 RepID=UPI00058AFB8C|nr:MULTISPECIES: hypothetical protein [Sporosarcina]WJY27833.1 hypothetical protein QWT68_02305 [Sporosarcina sp. 0.2-SM1T-5]
MAKSNENEKRRTDQESSGMEGTEYTDEQRHKNEVASTAYTGSDDKKKDLKNDRLETGGF